MTRILHGIARFACPPSDRRWVDALFAESDAVASRGELFLWLLGAVGFVVDRNVLRLASALSPLSLVLLLATAGFAVMAVTEYEGLAFEDDWYGVIAALLAAGFIGVAARNVRRSTPEPGL